MRKVGSVVMVAALAAVPLVGVTPSAGAVTGTWRNCTVVNQRLPHGVGLARAHDHTSSKPVTNFRHDTKMYRAAVRANKGLDRDKDGIACEKR